MGGRGKWESSAGSLFACIGIGYQLYRIPILTFLPFCSEFPYFLRRIIIITNLHKRLEMAISAEWQREVKELFCLQITEGGCIQQTPSLSVTRSDTDESFIRILYQHQKSVRVPKSEWFSTALRDSPAE